MHRTHPSFLVALLALSPVAPARAAEAGPETVRFFQETEQSLMDAIASGDKAAWERVLDPDFVITTEEGELIARDAFLKGLRPLPEGLKGRITVKELTVHEYPAFAVVRYLSDEWESVFGQEIGVLYRTTDTYRRDGPSWRLLASHVAVVTKDPPAQPVPTAGFPALVGKYKLLPSGWTFTVALHEGQLIGGRDPHNLRPLIPLTADTFVLSGSLGEWLFVVENGRATRVVNLRKFAPLVWTRAEDKPAVP
jgi:hypothetical protein